MIELVDYQLQALARVLLLGDVGIGAEPAHDLAVFAQRFGPGDEGAERSVRPAAQRKGHLERLAGPQRGGPSLEHSGQDIGVVNRLPAPAHHFFGCGAGVIVPPLVIPEQPAVGIGHPGQVRYRIGQGPELGVGDIGVGLWSPADVG